jgi:hypothetical protein
MEREDVTQGMERVNAGAPLVHVDPSLIEYIWEMRQNFQGGISVPEGMMPRNADQHIAMMFRTEMLSALTELGILDEYLQDESRRKQVFAAAASMACDKNDVHEALAYKHFRDSPPDAVTEHEMREAGYDPDHSKVGEKLIAWMHEHRAGND